MCSIKGPLTSLLASFTHLHNCTRPPARLPSALPHTHLLSNRCVMGTLHGHSVASRQQSQAVLKWWELLSEEHSGFLLPNSAGHRGRMGLPTTCGPWKSTASVPSAHKDQSPSRQAVATGRALRRCRAACGHTFHVGLDLPDQLVGLGAVEQCPDGGKGVQDNGLRVGVDVFLKESTPLR